LGGTSTATDFRWGIQLLKRCEVIQAFWFSGSQEFSRQSSLGLMGDIAVAAFKLESEKHGISLGV
jgi:hypothetical protein